MRLSPVILEAISGNKNLILISHPLYWFLSGKTCLRQRYCCISLDNKGILLPFSAHPFLKFSLGVTLRRLVIWELVYAQWVKSWEDDDWLCIFSAKPYMWNYRKNGFGLEPYRKLKLKPQLCYILIWNSVINWMDGMCGNQVITIQTQMYIIIAAADFGSFVLLLWKKQKRKAGL